MALLESPIFWITAALLVTLAAANTMGLFGGNQMPVDGKVKRLHFLVEIHKWP